MTDAAPVVPPLGLRDERAGTSEAPISSRRSEGGGPDPEFTPIPEDIYGFAIYQLVVNLNELRMGNIMTEKSRVVNTVLGICAGLLMLLVNITLQGLLLLFTKFYIVDPAQGEMAVNKLGFEHKFGNEWNMEIMQQAVANHDEIAKVVCEMPTSDMRFLYVILFCWTVVVMQDIRSSVELAMAVLCLPTTKDGEDMLEDTDAADGTVIASVTWPVRLAVLLLVAVPKFLIGVVLLHYGNLWLMACSGFMDLVLNAVALAFVVELSALLFSTFLSASMQGKVQDTQFKHEHTKEDDEETSWSSILVHAWNSHMSCIIMLGISFGVCYYYINFVQYGNHTMNAGGLDVLGAVSQGTDTLSIHKQVDIPCQRLVGNWWITHNSAGLAYPWYTQYLKEVEQVGVQRGSKSKRRKGGRSGGPKAVPTPDSEPSKQSDAPVKYENVEEKDVIQDTIENPQNLLPKDEKTQPKGGGADGSSTGEKAVPNSKLAVQAIAGKLQDSIEHHGKVMPEMEVEQPQLKGVSGSPGEKVVPDSKLAVQGISVQPQLIWPIPSEGKTAEDAGSQIRVAGTSFLSRSVATGSLRKPVRRHD